MLIDRQVKENGTPKAEIDDFMSLPLAEQKIRYFQEQMSSRQNIRFILQETDKTVSVEIESVTIAYGSGHFFRRHKKNEKFVYNKEKRKATIKTMGKETRRSILPLFDQFDWLRNPADSHCKLPCELFSDSVTTKILLRKITNPEQMCREYFKSLHLKGVDYKAYLALKCDGDYNPLARFPLTFLQEAFTDLNGALRLAHADSETTSILADMVIQAISLSKKINPRWSFKRIQAEHQKYTRLLMAAKLDAKHDEPIHEKLAGLEDFPEYEARLLNNEKETFNEGETMHHCIYLCYYPKIKRKEYLAFSFAGAIRATLGLRIRNGKLFFDQAFGILDRRLDSIGVAKIKQFLSDKTVERKLKEATGLSFDENILSVAASWFGNSSRIPAPAVDELLPF